MEKNQIVITFESSRPLTEQERHDLETRLFTEISEPEVLDQDGLWMDAEYDTAAICVDFRD